MFTSCLSEKVFHQYQHHLPQSSLLTQSVLTALSSRVPKGNAGCPPYRVNKSYFALCDLRLRIFSSGTQIHPHPHTSMYMHFCTLIQPMFFWSFSVTAMQSLYEAFQSNQLINQVNNPFLSPAKTWNPGRSKMPKNVLGFQNFKIQIKPACHDEENQQMNIQGAR